MLYIDYLKKTKGFTFILSETAGSFPGKQTTVDASGKKHSQFLLELDDNFSLLTYLLLKFTFPAKEKYFERTVSV